MTKGKLIVIEGLDRSGKSTQAALLQSALPDSILMKFPDRTTEIGKMIDAYLQSKNNLDDHAIHLLFSANRWELRDKIISLLDAGTTVILDRYVLSGAVYSIAKGLDKTWCMQCDDGLPIPDLTIFLDLSEEVSQQRGGFGEERYERVEMQRKVRTIFKDLLPSIPHKTLNADTTIDDLHTRINSLFT